MTVMSVGRCATCGEVTGEVVPAGEELTKTYCPSCESIQYNPTRAGTMPRVRDGFRLLFEEATMTAEPQAIQTNQFEGLETNENDQILCPMCGSNEFSWEGTETHRETVYADYRTRFYGHIYPDGQRNHEESDTEDLIRSDIEESYTSDTSYDLTLLTRCDNCGHSMGREAA